MDWFRRKQNTGGALAQAAGRASFTAYLVHAPITIALAIALRDVGVPTEFKFVAVFALTTIASFELGGLLARQRERSDRRRATTYGSLGSQTQNQVP